MSDKKTNYDLEANSGYGIKWNAGSYVKSTDGTLHLKGVELDFKNSSDTVVFTVDTDGNVDITGDYLVNGSPISGGSLDLSALTAKTTPVDADLTLVGDSAASFANKKVTWANIKATLKTYFDSLYESLTNKDATGGYAGLTLFKINFKNAANTFTSFFTNTNTAARTYTFQDRDGTIIDNTNLVTGSTDNAILRADGTGGVTTQSSGVSIDDSNNIVLPTTAGGATTGIVYKGSTRFVHNYFPSGNDGNNFFAGEDAGNFTMSGVSAFNGSYNTGVGTQALNGITSGYYNSGFGYQAGKSITTGAHNFCMGSFAGNNLTNSTHNTCIGSFAMNRAFTTSQHNVAIGAYALRVASGTYIVTYNTALGSNSLTAATTATRNTAVGYQTLLVNTSGADNIAIGYQANDIGTTGSGNIIIGKDADPSSATASNEMNIGGVIYGTGMYGTGKIGINTGAAPNSTLQVSGSVATAYVAKTGAYTLTANDFTVDCTSGTFAITLPTAASITGRIYVINNSGAGTITINTTSAQTINGAASGTITLTQYHSLTVQSDGANWIKIAAI